MGWGSYSLFMDIFSPCLCRPGIVPSGSSPSSGGCWISWWDTGCRRPSRKGGLNTSPLVWWEWRFYLSYWSPLTCPLQLPGKGWQMPLPLPPCDWIRSRLDAPFSGSLLGWPAPRWIVIENLATNWWIGSSHTIIFLVNANFYDKYVGDLDYLGLCERLDFCHSKACALVELFDEAFQGIFRIVYQAELIVVCRHICCRYAGVVLV